MAKVVDVGPDDVLAQLLKVQHETPLVKAPPARLMLDVMRSVGEFGSNTLGWRLATLARSLIATMPAATQTELGKLVLTERAHQLREHAGENAGSPISNREKLFVLVEEWLEYQEAPPKTLSQLEESVQLVTVCCAWLAALRWEGPA